MLTPSSDLTRSIFRIVLARNSGTLPIIAVCCFGALGLLDAVAQPAEPEVRRALPANSSAEPPTAPAVPFDPIVTPIASPSPAPAASPATSATTPEDLLRVSPDEPPKAEPVTSAVPADQPDKLQFGIANTHYAGERFDLAATEYEIYRRDYPQGPDLQAVLFRLAECYRVLRKPREARDLYETILVDFQQGEFVGNAAYRLGDVYFAEQNFKGALPMYEKAASLAKDPNIAVASRYNEARTLEKLGRRNETIQVYTEIIQMGGGKNPYRDAARNALASRFTELGRPADALVQYEALVEESEAPEIRAEAAVRAAAVSTQLGQEEKAVKYYAAAAKTDDGGRWRGIGVVGQLQNLYESKKYQQLISTFNDLQSSIPPESMPAALILVGNAERQLEDYEGAAKIYDRIAREYPNSREKAEAAFQKLVCLYQQKSPDLAKEIDRFLSQNGGSEAVNQAKLLKAEFLFNQDKFGEAGPLYLQLSTSDLEPKYRAEAVFKLGWCYAQVQNYEKAIEAYTVFVGDFRNHPLLPAAYLQRAMALQKIKNFDRALTDYDTIILNHPKAKERELALQQKALIYGQKDDYPQMIAAFEILLRDYPGSTAAAQGQFVIGLAEFEQKKYDKALERLKKAREINKDYYARATLKIITCHYYLDNKEELGKEIDAYVAAKAMPPVPSEVAGWLGIKLLSEGKTPDAVKYLSISAEGMASPDVYLALGRAQLDMSNWKEAVAALNNYLKTASEPVARARGLLALGEAQIGTREFAAAKKSAQQVLQLQPEGRLNAEGRLLSAEAEFAEGRYDAAAKAFSSVAMTFDDVAITPRALKGASDSFRKAGKNMEAQKFADELKQRYPEYAAPNTTTSTGQ